jgi:methylmalonyl-CoA mutase
VLAEATAMALQGAGAERVYLAGRPGAAVAALTAAGVDGFWYAGQDAVAVLDALQRGLGMATS